VRGHHGGESAWISGSRVPTHLCENSHLEDISKILERYDVSRIADESVTGFTIFAQTAQD
jgi:adenosylmethionine-8-amino-7-oxononanoate aminotransferase